MKSQYSREVISHLKGHARVWRVPRVYRYLPDLPQADFSPTHLHWPSLKSQLQSQIIAGFSEKSAAASQLRMHTHLPLVPMQQGRPVMTQSI